jgi:hypothetical protein
MIRTSLFVDDAAIFLSPKKDDVNFLASTLQMFGEVNGLVTNCLRSQVAPIRCENIYLDDILQAFPAKRCPFPMTYLGLPLSVRRLKRIHYQPLEDKVAIKLIPWVGKHVTFAGRSTLVNRCSLVLSSTLLPSLRFRWRSS